MRKSDVGARIFCAEPIAQADILESNHVPLPRPISEAPSFLIAASSRANLVQFALPP